jgi:hypothetical protein
MARGDVHSFAAWDVASRAGSFDLTNGGDTLKMGIVDNTVVPTMSTADPRWGSGGSTDFSANEVATGSTYSSGGPTMTGQQFTRTSNTSTIDFDNFTIDQDASGFDNAYYGILYDATDSGKHAIGYVDLGGPGSIQSGPFVFTVNILGFITWTSN